METVVQKGSQLAETLGTLPKCRYDLLQHGRPVQRDRIFPVKSCSPLGRSESLQNAVQRRQYPATKSMQNWKRCQKRFA